MKKIIVHVDPDNGNTCITRCVPWARLVVGDPPLPLEDALPQVRSVEDYRAVAGKIEWAETEEEFCGRVAKKLGLSNYIIVDEDPLLDGDRTFRNALRHDGGAFHHDMDKARDIHMGRIRKARDKELSRLDVETMKALGRSDDARRAEVEPQKQVLRDIPQTFELLSAKSTDALKAMWPSELPTSRP